MNKNGKLLNLADKIIISIGVLLFIGLFSSEIILGQTSDKNTSSVLEDDFYNRSVIRIKFLKENIIRIQIVRQGDKFRESGLNRYDFIQELNPGDLKVKISRSKNGFSAETSAIKLKGNKLTGEIVITDPSGKKVLLDQISADFTDSSSLVAFKADKEADWIGFGDQQRQRIYQRGYTADCDIRNVKAYIPVPFFMSTQGVGIMVNTTYRIVFDMCKSKNDIYSWADDSGVVDYYIMAGTGYKELLNLYTELTGRPELPPEWSFGLWYICRYYANDYESVSDALNFRRHEIPCDVIGLEPGWMQTNYDYSTKKNWHKERFYNPRTYINAIKRFGFKFELWLCNNYDLTYEEERRLNKNKPVDPQKPLTEISHKLPGTDEYPQQSISIDKITIKDEPWFEHLKKFVDQGVDFFKQDASNQVFTHPKRLWGNGMKDDEVHNLYPLLYSRQMYEGFKEHTNRRPVIFTPCGWIGFQACSGTWTGDTGGSLSALAAMLNTSVVGHGLSTVDMVVSRKEGIHFGYLQPWSQINSFYAFNMPWVQTPELALMHKFYSQLRSKLIPYLYSWAYYASMTGWPMLIPLTMEFPDDKNCRNNLHQYLLGRDLMVGSFNRNIYFPSGLWKDYWTGEIIQGPQEKEVSWPDDRGGSLYVRSGGIVPFGPIMQYRGEKPMDEITLYIFPDQKGSEFELYEDDGVSFEHTDGKYSKTIISAKMESNATNIEIGNSNGDFKGKVKSRKWNIIMHLDMVPGSVVYNGKPFPDDNYSWDESRKELTIKGIFSPAVILVK